MDKKEIEELFRQHYGRLLRLARCLLYDDEEARDVVSEVFASLLKPRSIVPSNLAAYLTVSVRNRCLDLLAQKDVRVRFEQAYVQEQSLMESVDEDDERLALLAKFMEHELRPHTMRVFRMRHIEGMKYQEIANTLGISRVMVYKHLSQAMEQLKDYISKRDTQWR